MPNGVLSLANATLGVLTSASLAIHAVGRGLAQAMGTLTKHGVKQVDRLLSNRGVDVWTFFAYWTPFIVGARTEVVVALDWTSFAADGQDTIVLSMVTGHGRATPLLWKTVASSTLKGNQRRYEYEVLRRLREVLPAGVKVTVLADRGFGDCKLFYALTTELAFEYVIRLRGDIYVTSAGGERRAAAGPVEGADVVERSPQHLEERHPETTCGTVQVARLGESRSATAPRRSSTSRAPPCTASTPRCGNRHHPRSRVRLEDAACVPSLHRRHRRDVPVRGPRPNGVYRRTLALGWSRGDPGAEGAARRRRLRCVLGLPRSARVRAEPRPALR